VEVVTRLCKDVRSAARLGAVKLVVQIQLKKAVHQTHAKCVEALAVLKRHVRQSIMAYVRAL
jgi:hypothetical protein